MILSWEINRIRNFVSKYMSRGPEVWQSNARGIKSCHTKYPINSQEIPAYLVVTPTSGILFTRFQFLQLCIKNVHQLLHQSHWRAHIPSKHRPFGMFSQFIGKTSSVFSTSDLKWQFILSQYDFLLCLRLLVLFLSTLLWWEKYLQICQNLQLIETNNFLLISDD